MLTAIIPVYRNAEAAIRLAHALTLQLQPRKHSLEILAVDDGSGDGTAERIVQAQVPLLRVVALSKNHGRACARNIGAEHARGEVLIFIDCDCLPHSPDLLVQHVAMLSQGSVASCGPIRGSKGEFWGRYQAAASRRRHQQYENGVPYAGTTANLAIVTSIFREAGGFDEGYRHYGFEDRDLLIRLSRSGRVAWCDDAPVQHLDTLTLEGVLTKMRQAGGPSAEKFSVDHPEAYRELGFSALDTRLHPWLKILGHIATPLIRSAGALDPLVNQRWVPYPVAAAIVKMLSGLAFMEGTMTITPE